MTSVRSVQRPRRISIRFRLHVRLIRLDSLAPV